VPGSSAYVRGAVVSYTDEVKAGVLGVRKDTLAKVGAVSKETAAEMAEGVRQKLGTDYALSVTGNAGPGISEGKPLGLVYIGLASADETVVHEYHFAGTRHEIKEAAADEALSMLCRALKK
jgi:PncC family amidohydrolase